MREEDKKEVGLPTADAHTAADAPVPDGLPQHILPTSAEQLRQADVEHDSVSRQIEMQEVGRKVAADQKAMDEAAHPDDEDHDDDHDDHDEHDDEHDDHHRDDAEHVAKKPAKK